MLLRANKRERCRASFIAFGSVMMTRGEKIYVKVMSNRMNVNNVKNVLIAKVLNVSRVVFDE